VVVHFDNDETSDLDESMWSTHGHTDPRKTQKEIKYWYKMDTTESSRCILDGVEHCNKTYEPMEKKTFSKYGKCTKEYLQKTLHTYGSTTLRTTFSIFQIFVI